MASSREIEKLERQYKENPEGMIFAPLANAYRNSGQPERAIEILTRGLELHPHHAPARIVLGRCHLDLGDDPGAESAFAQVLELDQENVIALKALADITDRGGRYDESIRWLNYLLEVDRNNDEARDQLARVTEAKLNAPPPPPPPPEPEPVAEPEEEVSEAAAEPTEGPAPGAVPAPVPEREPDWAPPEPATGAGVDPPPPSPWQPPPLATEAMDWDDMTIAAGPGGPSDALPEAPPEDEAPAPPEEPAAPAWEREASDGLDFQVERGDDIVLRPSAQNEFQAPDASEGLTLRPGDVNEYQTPSAAEGLSLHPSDRNEFQTPSDSEALGSGFQAEEPEETEPDDSIEPVEGLIGLEASSVGDVPRDESIFSDELADWTPPPSVEPSILDEEPSAAPPEGAPPPPPPPTPSSVPFEESAPLPGTAEASEEEPPVRWSPTADEPIGLGDSEAGAEEESPSAADESEPIHQPPPEPVPVPEPVVSAAEPEPEDADLVVTETMAELYLSQGHRYEALEVYRVLARRSPGDGRLQEKVAALEAQGAEAVAPRSFAVGDTGGRSVRDFFKSLLSARPKEGEPAPGMEPAAAVPPQREEGGEEGGPVYGRPTRPAQDPLSLSAVFGEDSSPVPPAVRGQEGESGERSGEGFSFDSFFGAKRGKGGKPSGTTRSMRHSREEEEDLDQFNAWLQGLKG